MEDAGEQTIGLIPMAIGAKITMDVLDSSERRRRRKRKGKYVGF